MEEKFTPETVAKLAKIFGIDAEVLTEEHKTELAEKLALFAMMLESYK